MSKRGSANKLTRITVLMMLSMLLLSGFLGYWLKAQYSSAQVALQKDLSRIFSRSVEDVTDSLLTGKIIRPMLAKEELIKFKVQLDTIPPYVLSDTNKEKDLLKVIRDTVMKKDRVFRKVITTTRQHSSSSGSLTTEVFDSGVISGIDYMRDGIKILIREMGGTGARSMKIDSAELAATFAARLEKEGLAFPVRWPNSTPGNDHIQVSERYPGKQFTMFVYDYKGHLFSTILPEILFALLLLSVIATAFVSMYRSYRAQERLSVMRNDLVSNMTHELRTPIATVKVALEALDSFRMINDPNTSRDYLQMAVSEMERLELLVNQALNTSLLETGTMTLQTEKQDVLSVVNRSVKAMQPKLDQAGAVVSLVAPNEHYPAIIDKLHMQGVLINLLDNSIKYADKPPVISIELTDKDSNIVISVKDNGPGIPQRYLDKVFDKFFRVPTGPVHNTSGYGLGLSYARQVAEQQGGSISVANNETGGCTFSVTLPKAVS